MSPRQALSVTLEADNVTWLKGRAAAGGAKSVSDLLDQLVSEARQAGRIGPVRSVAGTIDVDAADPLLETADAAIRGMYEFSVGRPLVARETSSKYGATRRHRRASAKRRG